MLKARLGWKTAIARSFLNSLGDFYSNLLCVATIRMPEQLDVAHTAHKLYDSNLGFWLRNQPHAKPLILKTPFWPPLAQGGLGGGAPQ